MLCVKYKRTCVCVCVSETRVLSASSDIWIPVLDLCEML